MKTLRSIAIVLSLIVVQTLFAQNELIMKFDSMRFDPNLVNQVDSLGRKHGVWIDDQEDYITIGQYVGGLLDGLVQTYRMDGFDDDMNMLYYLIKLTTYKRGIPQSIMEFELGSYKMSYYVYDIKLNEEKLKGDTNMPPYFVGRYKDYDNGILVEEGTIAYGGIDSPHIIPDKNPNSSNQ